MTGTSGANALTDNLLSIIRQQRHLATRVIISTQEPTISPSLLELCNMTIVHRFSSPKWLQALGAHIAAVARKCGEGDDQRRGLLKQILELNVGEALLFCPSAMLRSAQGIQRDSLAMETLGTGYLKIQVRQRVTADGGGSLMAV